MGEWKPIDTAPMNLPILAWCNNEENAYVEDKSTGRLTLYAAHGEGLSYAPTGMHIVEWGGAFDDTCHEDFHYAAHLPDWWFVAGSDFEVVANPTHWIPLPKPPLPSAKQD